FSAIRTVSGNVTSLTATLRPNLAIATMAAVALTASMLIVIKSEVGGNGNGTPQCRAKSDTIMCITPCAAKMTWGSFQHIKQGRFQRSFDHFLALLSPSKYSPRMDNIQILLLMEMRRCFM